MWIEIYHSSNGHFTDVRPIYIYLCSVMFVVVTILIVGDIVTNPLSPTQKVPVPVSLLEKALFYLDTGMYLLASLGYLIYGARFWCRLSTPNTQPLLSKMRRKVLPRVIILTVLCTGCFILRGFVTLYFVFVPLPDVEYWWMDPVYFGCLEILPLCLMLSIFRHNNNNSEGNETCGSCCKGGDEQLSPIGS